MNELQLNAVQAPLGYVQIIAGPGTGKTVTLVNRIVELLKRDIDPQKMLVMSFTRAAAQEIRERVAAVINDPIKARKIPIGTFHSMAIRLIRQYGSPELKRIGILDDHEKDMVIKQIIIDFRWDQELPAWLRETQDLQTPVAVQKYLAQQVSRIQQLFYREKSPLGVHEDQSGLRSLNKFAETYFARLKLLNRMDFDGILLVLYQMLLEPECEIPQMVEAVLVDEFQDTSTLQLKLMLELASKCHNATVVGDPDQSIYNFRNANPENFNLMVKETTSCQLYYLEYNYRSEQPILDVALKVINSNARFAQDRKLIAKGRSAYKTPVQILDCGGSGFEDCAREVCKQVETLIRSGIKPQEICILARNSRCFSSFESALFPRNIEVKMVGGKKHLAKPEIMAVVCFIRLCMYSDDSLSIQQTLPFTKPKISAPSISSMMKDGVLTMDSIRSRSRGRPALQRYLKIVSQFQSRLYELIGGVNNDDDDQDGMKPELKLEPNRDFEDTMPATSVLKSLVREIAAFTGCDGAVLDETIDQFRNICIDEGNEYVYSNDRDGILSFIDEYAKLWALGPSNVERSTAVDCVTLSTIHSAKGLEWPIVFVVGYGDQATATSTEETRLLYVALTRAQSMLVIPTASRIFADLLKESGSLIYQGESLKPNFAALTDCVKREIKHVPKPVVSKTTQMGSLTLPEGFEFGSDVKHPLLHIPRGDPLKTAPRASRKSSSGIQKAGKSTLQNGKRQQLMTNFFMAADKPK